MKNKTLLMCALGVLASSVTGCAHARSTVASVDILAIEQRWPKFINYSRQLQANYIAINESKISADEKRKALLQWQQQSARWQDEVTGDVRDAVSQIAANDHYQLVVTRQGTFGGDDITSDVEKALKIDISASPPPSQ